ncbi:MAG: T9SS type A sorting domain-containing protein, partial [Ferruginibacter sp.]
ATEFTLIINNNTGMFSIRLTDLQGREIYKSEGIAGNKYKFGKKLLSAVYILEVLQGKMKQVFKLVKE